MTTTGVSIRVYVQCCQDNQRLIVFDSSAVYRRFTGLLGRKPCSHKDLQPLDGLVPDMLDCLLTAASYWVQYKLCRRIAQLVNWEDDAVIVVPQLQGSEYTGGHKSLQSKLTVSELHSTCDSPASIEADMAGRLADFRLTLCAPQLIPSGASPTD